MPALNPRSRAALLLALRRTLARREPLLARVLSDAMLSAWLLGGRGVAARLPDLHLPPNAVAELMPSPPSVANSWTADRQQVAHFPQIEIASNDLQTRSLLTPHEFAAAEHDARQRAFTVARLASLDSLDRVRNALVDDVREGGTLQSFRQRVESELGKSALAPAHLETIYRDNVATAYSRGQEAILAHPLVGGEFPFVLTEPIRDSRLSEMCAIVSRSGIEGTGVYLRSDPEYQRVVRVPRHHNCRCVNIPLSIADAAKRGLRYAREWQQAGEQPQPLPHVTRVPVDMPAGWTR